MTRALVATLLAVCAASCVRTQDIYVGGDLAAQPQDGDGAQGGGQSAVTPLPSEPTIGSSGSGAVPPEPEPGGREDEDEGDIAGEDTQPDAAIMPGGNEQPAPNCPSGWGDCDGDPDNGCEAELASDALNCGACGAACGTPDCACEGGRQVVACLSGHGDCDGDAANGCEADLQSDLAHCGACDRACHADGAGTASAECNAGRCELTCGLSNLRGDCDGDPENGCETDLFHDVDNCGGCGMRCNACLDGICL